jgi:hypothetical protein
MLRLPCDCTRPCCSSSAGVNNTSVHAWLERRRHACCQRGASPNPQLPARRLVCVTRVHTASAFAAHTRGAMPKPTHLLPVGRQHFVGVRCAWCGQRQQACGCTQRDAAAQQLPAGHLCRVGGGVLLLLLLCLSPHHTAAARPQGHHLGGCERCRRAAGGRTGCGCWLRLPWPQQAVAPGGGHANAGGRTFAAL